MADAVTLAEAKAWLRVDHADDDATIALLIRAATDAVRDVADGWDGTDPAPDRVKLAVLARVAVSFDQRTSLAAGAGELPMLTPLRTLET